MNPVSVTRAFLSAAVLAALLLCNPLSGFAAPGEPPPNPYQVERSWPPYFLEHQKLFTEQAGTYKAGKNPVWTVHVPGGWIGNSTIIEGDDGLIVYDTSANVLAGAFKRLRHGGRCSIISFKKKEAGYSKGPRRNQ